MGLERDWLVVLELGEQVRRRLRLANPSLSFKQRTYEGSHTVVIEGSWRLEGPESVLVTCLDVRSPTDRVQAGLEELEGREVEAVEVQKPAHDLVVRFSGGFVLRAFVLEPLPAPAVSVPDGHRPPSSPQLPRSCWSVYTPSGQIQVGPHGRLGDPEIPERPTPGPGMGPKLSVIEGEGSS